VGQPSIINLDAIYIKSSFKRPLLAHCNLFRHVGYDKGLCPTPYCNDKHEQVKFILNTIDFKVLIFITFILHSFNSLFSALALKLNFSFNFVSTPMSIKFDHVKPSLVHDSFHIQNIEMIPLVQFKDVIFFNVYKRCENMSQKTWYYLTQESFFDYMYKV